MIRAAGILFLAGDQALFLRRTAAGDHTDEWCLPGGKLEDGETAEQAALREAQEEIGVDVPSKGIKPWTRSVTPALVPPAVEPTLTAADSNNDTSYDVVYRLTGEMHASRHKMTTKNVQLALSTAKNLAGFPSNVLEVQVTRESDGMTIYSSMTRADSDVADEGVDWTTFIVRVPEPFHVKLNDEHDGYAWAPVTNPPQPLHPGVQVDLDRLTMDELGVARAIADGRLASPQRYENVWLFAMRITGTGASYRQARKEFVWREPSVYLNDEFLARCAGLPVIWEHPEKSLLNSEEFADRAIGSIMFAYFRPDLPTDVWGIAKIYDDQAAEEMREKRLSTSPAVNFADPSENDRMKLEDGQVMLIEGKPSLLDHLAVCKNGVWDKGGPPTGIESVAAADADAPPPLDFLPVRVKATALLLKAASVA